MENSHDKDFYHPLINGELVRAGEKAQFLTTGHDHSRESSTPVPLGIVFEKDGTFVFSRSENARGVHPIPDGGATTVGNSRAKSNIFLPGTPRGIVTHDHLILERVPEGVRVRVPSVSDIGGFTYMTRKLAGETFGEAKLVEPDRYYRLSGSHQISPGESARILCPGDDVALGNLLSDHVSGKSPIINDGRTRTNTPVWHAGDLVSESGQWAYINPRAENPEAGKVPLQVGQMVFIGRGHKEGWQHGAIVTVRSLERPDESPIEHCVGPHFYGSRIDEVADMASRWHAVIEVNPQGAVIRDFSSNGTLFCVTPSGKAFSDVRRSAWDEKERSRTGRFWQSSTLGDGIKLRRNQHPLEDPKINDELNELLWMLQNAQKE